ncbi:probable complex I intermediate-associated protein CIA30 precursor, mitochondrial [Rhynchosporium agropyri]|uniref:Probable complex I intermediate-associated protein CIA30, mitochondrial n=1 Tax=Rhynchosporium agropyri TaxID=914238 RepID=A0A1E1KSN6_9HELO|nr:probable complex I intermediate-associated protein CIA30 precursor, mitochondrial [Rhynchosporium agropyri]
MRPTPNLFAKGFFGRSLDEFKRLSGFALRAEGTRRQMKPYNMAIFHDPSSLEDVKTMSDMDIGGYSKVHLDYIPPPVTTSSSPSAENSSTSPTSTNPNGHVKFHGNISIELPKNRPEVQRTGYAAWRTKDKGYTIFGKTLWDIDAYAFLALRIKSDGRKYFVNIQTESIVYTDIHQHRLYARRPGEWETVLIKWNEFVRTNHGMVVEPQTELMRQKVRTVGIGLIDRVPGPFELCVERIWASNGLGERELGEDDRFEEGTLKSKHGEKIRWGNEEKKP